VRELVDFTRAGHARHLPYLVVYEMVRAAGFFLGRNAMRLPRRVRRPFSDYKSYWDRFESPSRRASANGVVEARR